MSRPNVVIILADDLGFSDIEPFGGEIDTPALQALSERGVRMSSFYVTPRCSPSRAALLTGHHPHSVGIGVLTSDDRPYGYPGSLSPSVPTIAERLRADGYSTGIFGKWHLSSEVRVPSASWPTRRGFDEFRGILPGATSYYGPPIVDGERYVDADEIEDDFYLTDDITASGVDFVQRHAAHGDPFFLLLTYTAPHWPLQAAESDVAKYRARFAEGWDVARQRRLERIGSLGVVPDVHTPPERPPQSPWTEEDRAWQIERMSVYAAQVESLDRGVGRILDALRATGVDDDTLILFLSDNGGCSEDLPPGFSGFSDLVCPPLTPDGRPVRVGNDPAIMPGPSDTYQSYGEDWATVSNTPFRMWKRWVHEGGISSPLIASWPAGGIDGSRTLVHTPAHLIDVFPTVLEAALVAADTEGQSLLGVWRDPTDTQPDRTLFWEHVGNAAVRKGTMKLVREWGGPWELYDLSTDRIEQDDLSASMPELVSSLVAEYDAWADAHGVIPWQQVLDGHSEKAGPSSRPPG